MSNLTTDWTKNITDAKKKEDFISAVKNSKVALGRLQELLVEDEKDLLSNSLTEYQTPNWDYLVADKNGQLRYLRKMKARLAFLDGSRSP